MDDRMVSAKIGKPIPEWDKAHRLPISGWVGPECKDSATTFQTNSIFMDVTDQSHLIRQWFVGAMLVALLMTISMMLLFIKVISVSLIKGGSAGFIFFTIVTMFGVVFFGVILIRHGRKEFFSFTHYPIRFNRRDKKLHAILRTDLISAVKLKSHDLEEINWDDNSIFCIHREEQETTHYWIRYYKIDSNGLVQKAVAIGRDWEGIEGLEELIAQWNYWCWYMNRGPDDLPKPILYLSKSESFSESFLTCMYEIDPQGSPQFRIIAMPMFLTLAFYRVLSLLTCRHPVWPANIAEICKIDPADPFDEPRGKTPIGWYATNLAIFDGTYPSGDRKKIDEWTGEPDAGKNAQLWAEDVLSVKKLLHV